MKKHISILLLTMSAAAFAQEGRVGINTTEPKATLDVTASATDLTRTDGFIAPRLKGDELKAKDSNYTNDQTGAIVYATDASSDAGVAGKKTINVSSAGYYYFDGAIWQKLVTTPVDKTDDEWINDPANTRIHLGKLSDGVTVRLPLDNVTIKDNGFVGFGTDNPTRRLELLAEQTDAGDDILLKSINATGEGRSGSIIFSRARGTLNSPTPPLTGDTLGALTFRGYTQDGGFLTSGANIMGIVDDSPTSNSIPARLQFMVYDKDGFVSYMLYTSKGLGINTFPQAKLHVVKAATDLTPAIIVGCNEYTDNTAATTAGLPVGALYRTGDVLKVVH